MTDSIKRCTNCLLVLYYCILLYVVYQATRVRTYVSDRFKRNSLPEATKSYVRMLWWRPWFLLCRRVWQRTWTKFPIQYGTVPYRTWYYGTRTVTTYISHIVVILYNRRSIIYKTTTLSKDDAGGVIQQKAPLEARTQACIPVPYVLNWLYSTYCTSNQYANEQALADAVCTRVTRTHAALAHNQ